MNALNKIKYILSAPKSRCLSKKYPMPFVMNDSETLNYIIENGCSVVRYGDGELNLMRGVGIKFQKANVTLQNRLNEIATADSKDNVLICLPNIFASIDAFTEESGNWWKNYLKCTRGYWYKNFRLNRYGDTNITRFYVENKDKNRDDYVTRLKSLWANKRVLIVEGEKSRLGMGNDLFCNAQSIRRLICPSANAFERYNEIVAKTSEQVNTGDFDMIVCALGPTATVLCYDLSERIQALDMGHVDVEYEWYLSKAKSKQAIKNKSVTEVADRCDDDTDEMYMTQIIGVIE